MSDTSTARWVPLHVHSQYSILDASAPVEQLAAKAKEYGMPAVALTDHANLFGAVEFYKACKGAGVKAIIGCDLYVASGSRTEKAKDSNGRVCYSLVLLAKDDVGYRNLCKLSSIGFLEGFYYFPRIDKEVLEQYHEGLICLSGAAGSRIAQEVLTGTPESTIEEIKFLHNIFGDDFYLELQRHPMSEDQQHDDGFHQESWLLQQYEDYIAKQNRINDALIAAGKQLNIPLVATNDSHYINRDDWRAHEILLNVQSGEPCEIWEKDSLGNPKFRVANPKRRTYPTHELYFKSQDEMAALFADCPEALANTLVVAEKCHLKVDFDTKHYPVYIPPSLEGKSFDAEERVKEVEKYLRELCEKGIPKRYNAERLAKVGEIYPGKEPMTVVLERLEYEMNIIAPKGMCDYLLIVWDFIHWAKSQGIPVGPGRGSGAGSIVLYLIGITDIEPLRFHLFFERFINPERISYPDIDVDICMGRRGEVINYTLQKYGKENVAQIITFGTMKARMAIKDVGRVLSVPLSKVNDIAKLVPEELDITLEKALEKDLDLKKMYHEDEEARRILDLGMTLEGSIRNTGIHAAGIIISGEPLTQFIPLCNAKDSDMPVTQFSMKPVEAVGMLKIDFLGLKTLTAIKVCVDEIRARTGREIDWVDLPLNDMPTFNLLNQGKTLGVFQLESGGMQDLARQLHLDCFEEIIAVGALYRPGPMDMIPSFINRKHGREPIEYDHEWMNDILSETYGIMVYQEQVMQIASRLANYSLGEGDVLRRAMGKKDHEQMLQQREKFVLGAQENNISEAVAKAIFDKMEKFASYGFNKSHAAAYGYLSYVTAYMKANYPKEWMAALLTCDSDDITKVAKFISESQSMGIKMLPPDINEAGVTFAAVPQGIRFAMSGIKGIGSGVVEAIVKERAKNGKFSSLYNFIKRIDKRTVGKKAIENLVDAGSFDFTGWSRDELRESVEPAYESALKEQKDNDSGVMTFFAMLGDSDESRFSKPPQVKQKRSPLDLLLKEKELLGFFLTGHPMDAHKEVLYRLSCVSLHQMDTLPDSTIFRSAFIVETVQTRISQKTQKKFAIMTISDGIERHELPIWAELYEEKQHLLKENQLLYAVLQGERQPEGEFKLSCRWLDDLTKASEEMMAECDAAFDKVKHAVARQQRAIANGPKKKEEKPKEEKMPITKISVRLDIEKTRHSHILLIKEIFGAHRGTLPVQIDFYRTEHKLAAVDIDTRWGVTPSPALKQKLSAIHSVIHVEEL